MGRVNLGALVDYWRRGVPLPLIRVPHCVHYRLGRFFAGSGAREPRYLSQRSASVQLYQCDAASSEFGFRFPTLKSSECRRISQRFIKHPERNMTWICEMDGSSLAGSWSGHYGRSSRLAFVQPGVRGLCDVVYRVVAP